jgi:hypothetical protein
LLVVLGRRAAVDDERLVLAVERLLAEPLRLVDGEQGGFVDELVRALLDVAAGEDDGGGVVDGRLEQLPGFGVEEAGRLVDALEIGTHADFT